MALIAFRTFSKMLCYFAFSKKYFFIYLVFIHGLKYLHTFLTKDFFSGSHQKLFFCSERREWDKNDGLSILLVSTFFCHTKLP